MAFALLANTGVGNNGAGPTTTTGIDTTGAGLLVVAVAAFQITPTWVDSEGNKYFLGHPVQGAGENPTLQLGFCLNPNTAVSHTIQVASGFPGICFAAFSRDLGNTCVPDQQSDAVGSTNLAPGSITPSADGSLVVTAIGQGGNGTLSIDGGFAITDQVGGTTAQKCGLAYLIQTSAVAANPTWSWTGSIGSAAQIISLFEMAGGSAGGGAVSVLSGSFFDPVIPIGSH